MSVIIKCPYCSEEMQIDDSAYYELNHKLVDCPACSQPFTVCERNVARKPTPASVPPSTTAASQRSDGVMLALILLALFVPVLAIIVILLMDNGTARYARAFNVAIGVILLWIFVVTCSAVVISL